MTAEYTFLTAEASRLLSFMFYNPEETFFAEPDIVVALSVTLSKLNSEMAEDAARLLRMLAETDRKELMLDYSALFVGPFQLQAPPYGSVHLDRNKRLNDESTEVVAGIYRSFGLEVEGSMKEPADHIAIELEFIYSAFIIFANMKAENKDTAELEKLYALFYNRYFMPFAKQLADMMQKNAATEFYRTLSRLLLKFSEFINKQSAAPYTI